MYIAHKIHVPSSRKFSWMTIVSDPIKNYIFRDQSTLQRMRSAHASSNVRSTTLSTCMHRWCSRHAES